MPLCTFLSDRLSEALDQILTGERAQEVLKKSSEATKPKKGLCSSISLWIYFLLSECVMSAQFPVFYFYVHVLQANYFLHIFSVLSIHILKCSAKLEDGVTFLGELFFSSIFNFIHKYLPIERSEAFLNSSKSIVLIMNCFSVLSLICLLMSSYLSSKKAITNS